MASVGMSLYAVGGLGPNAGLAAASDGLSVREGTQTGLDHPPDIVPSDSEDFLTVLCPSPEPEDFVSDDALEADESADAACPGPEEVVSDEGGVQILQQQQQQQQGVHADLDVDGVAEEDEETTGAFLAKGGTRKRISLSILPPELFPEEEPGFWFRAWGINLIQERLSYVLECGPGRHTGHCALVGRRL